jgi:hypothetical protein
MKPTRTLLLPLLATLAAATPAAAQGYETSAMVGEVDRGRVTTLSSGPERVTAKPVRPAAAERPRRVARQAAVAPKAPVAVGAVAVLLVAFGLLVAPRRRGTS